MIDNIAIRNGKTYKVTNKNEDWVEFEVPQTDITAGANPTGSLNFRYAANGALLGVGPNFCVDNYIE